MSIRAMKTPKFADVPVSVLLQIANDPEGFERELQRYADATEAAGVAEAAAKAARRETEEAEARLKNASELWNADRASQEQALIRTRAELNRDRLDLEAKRKALDERARLLLEGENRLHEELNNVKTATDLSGELRRQNEVKAAELTKWAQDLKARADELDRRAIAFTKRLEALRADL